MVIDGFDIFRLAIRSEAHDLVFARIDFESRVIRKGRVQQSDRVRKWNFPQRRQGVPFTEPSGGRRPFSDSVHAQDRGLLIRRGKKGGGCVRLMVLAKEK